MSTVTLVFTDGEEEVDVSVDFGDGVNEKSPAHIYAGICLQAITNAPKENE